MMSDAADFGVIGLAVMGQNLALNMSDHGLRVAVYNRTVERTREFVAGPGADALISGMDAAEDLVAALPRPRRILLMVKAGPPVDAVLADLAPLLDEGDVVIDGGNSHYTDTARRVGEMAEHGIRFVGAGISGGEEGARHGPSIMPGGDPEAWPLISDALQAIAAKVADGTPCADWVGPGGAGHYVKMVHNGIEYGDIQLLAEAYDIMHTGLGMTHEEMADTFRSWNEGRLDSYLVEITAEVMSHRTDGRPTLEMILDAAGQKGTGRWTVEDSLQMGQPVTLVAEAVFARSVSALKEERTTAAGLLSGPDPALGEDRDAVLADLESALYASKIVSYAQGFMLLDAASAEHQWSLDPGGIALLWRQGCIIRAAFLERIRDAYLSNPELGNLLLDPYFAGTLTSSQDGWRRTVARAATSGIPVAALGTALAFFDSYRSERLPANLIQALRDYFGAHTYERVDRPRGEFFHTDWTGEGGDVAAGSYNA
jgi:6-phosphogluconate dehydrogenase